MPINGYLGNVISATAPTVNSGVASGIFTLEEQMQAAGTWPVGGYYLISRSVRIRASASAYFSRTPSSATNRSTWTYSAWIKKSPLDYNQSLTLLSAGSFGSDLFTIQVTDNGLSVPCIAVYGQISGSAVLNIAETPARRDPSAWFHLVVVLDTTQATASNRLKLYYNGAQVTALTTATYPNQNTTFAINNNQATAIGARAGGGAPYYDGYLTEINFVDGQALTPTSFGATDAVTGVWNPIRYTGTYGTNGFYLNFSDNSGATATTIGKDSSGNGNNWTPNNISVTAGTTYDSMVDVPTNYGSDTGAGGEVRGDYCTFNPLNATDTTFSNGNLRMVTASPGYGRPHLSTFGIASGQKFYAEFVVTSVGASSDVTIGIDDGSIVPAYYSNSGSTSGLPANFRGYRNGGGTYVGSTYTSGSPGISYTNGNTISVAVDRSANQITYYKNGSSVYTQSIASSVDQYYLCVMTFTGSADLTLNAGQTAFSYTAPSGFKALCTQNLPTPTISNGANYMAATLWTGTGVGSRAITNTSNGVSFQPDWVWIKSRSAAYSHQTNDSVRGATNGCLYTDLTNAVDANFGITSFDASGFTLGNTASLISSSFASQNGSGTTFVGWQWKASGSTVSNTVGSITSTVNANTTAGFSILTYTGNGTVGATVGHGLGATPGMVIVKSRSATADWPVKILPYMTGGQRLELSTTNAITTEAAGSGSLWNATNPNSTVITLGNQAMTNTNGTTYVAYCFAPITGYSAFGSYTGNGSTDGPFVFTNMRPRWLMFKRTDTTNNWIMYDTSRSTYNAAQNFLYPDLANTEGTGVYIDFVSNGFKLRDTNAIFNASGGTYIYAAFAENPFTISRAR
jgi:hypothetical protein